MTDEEKFDVFLSHNSGDKEIVRQLADKLMKRKVKVWLDERELVPGQPWQDDLQKIISTTQSAAVLVGPSGLGPWEKPEIAGCLSEFVSRKLSVIPVMLPGAPSAPVLPLFLRQFTWVDLRSGITREGLDSLVWGITRKRPEPSSNENSASEITESSPIKHGKYVILKSLPSGLISSLEIADDKQLDRKVVIKTLVRPEDEMHFKAEVRELSRVGKHPNIVSVYGAWLDDKDPHYVREYIEGQSLHHKLRSDGKANLAIDFVHQVLITIGDAMIFAMQKNVFDLGLEPEKVLVRANDFNSNSGLVSNYGIVVSPGSGGSEYVKHELPQRLSRERQLYVPPEYFHDNLTSVNPHRANQYRLGILGYEMLVGSKEFFDIAGRQKDPSSGEINWPPLKSVDKTERFPRFLRDAIDRMIKRDPKDRYPTLEDAVEAVARRDVLVEVARDSFRRIIDKDDSTRFFHEFYTQLLKNKNIKKIFDSAGFPSNKKNVIDSQKNWVRQYGLLKEAIVLLFAHSLLNETDEPTVLSRICETHAKFMSIEYYDEFREKLLESVVKFDKGTDPRKLESAWRQAIEPGLSYLKSRFSSAQQESESGRDGGRLDGYEKVRAESRQQGVLLGRIAVLQELLGVDRTSSDELSGYDDERLSEIENELQSQLRNR